MKNTIISWFIALVLSVAALTYAVKDDRAVQVKECKAKLVNDTDAARECETGLKAAGE
jgi:hypothetical protein